VSTTGAVRAAVLAAAAPAVISELAVAEDLAGRLIEVQVPELDLRRVLRAIWDSTPGPPAGPARNLISHILSRRRGPAPGTRADGPRVVGSASGRPDRDRGQTSRVAGELPALGLHRSPRPLKITFSG
jgi:hypothetical protein